MQLKQMTKAAAVAVTTGATLFAAVPGASAATHPVPASSYYGGCRGLTGTAHGNVNPCSVWDGGEDVGFDVYASISGSSVAVYASLLNYNGPGSSSYTGQSIQIPNGGWSDGAFYAGNCGNYVIGVGYWEGGTWYGVWESAPVSAC